MMAPQSTPSPPTSLHSGSGPSSFIDRLSQWASENRAVVYTVAGVAVVVTGAGVYYYANSSKSSSSESPADEKKRASKKERRKAKKEKEKGEAASSEGSSDTAAARVATVEPEPSEGLPTINEETVDTFSKEVNRVPLFFIRLD